VTHIEEPEHNKQYSLTLDAEAVTRWALENHIDLVLHGHMHQPSCVKLTRPVQFLNARGPKEDWRSVFICGLGSSGVMDDHFAEHRANTFGVLGFESNSLSVKIYEIDPQKKTTKDSLVCNVSIPLP
jgi:hypothetical protein